MISNPAAKGGLQMGCLLQMPHCLRPSAPLPKSCRSHPHPSIPNENLNARRQVNLVCELLVIAHCRHVPAVHRFLYGGCFGGRVLGLASRDFTLKPLSPPPSTPYPLVKRNRTQLQVRPVQRAPTQLEEVLRIRFQGELGWQSYTEAAPTRRAAKGRDPKP